MYLSLFYFSIWMSLFLFAYFILKISKMYFEKKKVFKKLFIDKVSQKKKKAQANNEGKK